jgi:uncharacterized tellurite resistance protein B-like protein
MESRISIHQKLNDYFTTTLPERLASPLLKQVNCLNKGDFNKRFDIRFASDEAHLGHWWRQPIYLLTKPNAKKVQFNFTLQPQRWPSNPTEFAQEHTDTISQAVSEITNLIVKHQLESSKVEFEVKTENKFLLSIAFSISMGGPDLVEADYIKCVDFMADLALINHQLSEKLVSQANDSEDDAAVDSETDDEDDDDNDLGFPSISLTLGENVTEEMIGKYFSRWQKPSSVFDGRLGINGYIPDFVNVLVDDNSCPVFSGKDFDAISNQISENKIIPILDYLPAEFHAQNDKPWWVVPYCIWRDDNASLIVLNKNGLFALYENLEELRMIFSMESIEKVEFERAYEDDRFINRLYVHTADGYMTLDEFVLSESHIQSASYLSILATIIEVRQATINASKGQPMWYEGVGGEGFASMNSALDMVSAKSWENPFRPNPADFGYNNNQNENTSSDDNTNDHKSIILNDILASLAFLYICVAGADSGINATEMETVQSKLSEWKEDGDVTDCLNFVVSYWKTLDSDQEKLMVEEVAHMLKAHLEADNLKAIKSDLLQIVNADEVIADTEKGIILFICSIFD